MIESYRQQRLKEMKKEQVLARFGSVQPIGRDGYSREVTDASKVDEDDVEGRGTGVVCFLYKDAYDDPSVSQALCTLISFKL
jgi:hypothetical protein